MAGLRPKSGQAGLAAALPGTSDIGCILLKKSRYCRFLAMPFAVSRPDVEKEIAGSRPRRFSNFST